MPGGDAFEATKVQPTRMLNAARSFARTVPVVTAPQRCVGASFLERSWATARLPIRHRPAGKPPGRPQLPVWS
jgi:hypothetical protein